MERECGRNVEVMWLTGRLAPDFKTIADFRKDNGKAIRLVCREFVKLCRKLNLFADAFVAIDGSKFKAVNNRDRNFTKGKLKGRLRQIDQSIERYLGQLASADRHPDELTAAKHERLETKIGKLKEEIGRLERLEVQMLATPLEPKRRGDLANVIFSTLRRMTNTYARRVSGRSIDSLEQNRESERGAIGVRHVWAVPLRRNVRRVLTGVSVAGSTKR